MSELPQSRRSLLKFERSPEAVRALVAAKAAAAMHELVVSSLDEVLMDGPDELVTRLTFTMPGGVRLRIEGSITLAESGE